MNNVFTYRQEVTVIMDGKKVGVIRELPSGNFQYLPNGKKSLAGDEFETLEACKRSLEEE